MNYRASENYRIIEFSSLKSIQSFSQNDAEAVSFMEMGHNHSRTIISKVFTCTFIVLTFTRNEVHDSDVSYI